MSCGNQYNRYRKQGRRREENLLSILYSNKEESLLGASEYCARLHDEKGYEIKGLFDHIMQLALKGIRYSFLTIAN